LNQFVQREKDEKIKGRVAERENFLLRAWMFSHRVCTGNVCFAVYMVT